ncbi:MAG: alanine--tRNA ligase, partial [Clostridiales bacterium]|nr:alanine--tRNA ligase [Clostridiales bacterium]
MEPFGLNELREKFLAFFESKEHLRLKSYSLVPGNDKSLLLINAGMAPMKTYFTGQETPPGKRVVTCQKCVRTGDIENVGKTARHGTFFEMLGNFSFGNYFKADAIPWAWEFITQVMKIPEEKLYVTIYLDDDEAFDIWTKVVGLEPSRITRFGKEENFWEHGLGPCGPCSEIHYDKGEAYSCGKETCGIGCDCDRYLEIWNLVFTQFNREEDGSYSPLKAKNIDTGMGLERLACIMQGVDSIFDVDTIRAIREKVCEITGKAYNANPENEYSAINHSAIDISIRVITDHVRSVVFLMADGVTPSNEGRGYVLRRLLRRAARHGKLLGKSKFLAELADTVIENSKCAYPELAEKRNFINKMIAVEEDRFNETLDQGLAILRGHVNHIKENNLEKHLPGTITFQLYDTFGFPLDLMKEILDEEGIRVSEAEFKAEMRKQSERARIARAETTYMGADETAYHQLDVNLCTEFVGYKHIEVKDAKVIAIICNGKSVELVSAFIEAGSIKTEPGANMSILLDKTPFYAESGGQKGDRGVIVTSQGTFEVVDTIKVIGGKIAHIGKVKSGFLKIGESARAVVDKKRRDDTRRNHTATHLLQKALRDTLGTHVEQAGSSVSDKGLRFDFTHFNSVTFEELRRVEDIVNELILEEIPVCISEKTIDEARKMGAM